MTDKSITISIDAMGGDNAPSEIVKGAVLAVNKNSFLNILLVGDEDQIKNSLSMLGPSALEFIETNRITVVPSEGVIKDGEQPVVGFKKKPKSSIAIFIPPWARTLWEFMGLSLLTIATSISLLIASNAARWPANPEPTTITSW